MDYKSLKSGEEKGIRCNDKKLSNVKAINVIAAGPQDTVDWLAQRYKAFAFTNRLANYQGSFDIVVGGKPADGDLSSIKDISMDPAIAFADVPALYPEGSKILWKRQIADEPISGSSYPTPFTLHCDTAYSPKFTGHLHCTGEYALDLANLHIEGHLSCSGLSGRIERTRIINNNSSDVAIFLDGCNELVLENIEIHSQNQAIFLYNCTNVVIRDLKIVDDSTGYFPIYIEGCSGVILENVLIEGSQDGIRLSNSSHCILNSITWLDHYEGTPCIEETDGSSANICLNIRSQRGSLSYSASNLYYSEDASAPNFLTITKDSTSLAKHKWKLGSHIEDQSFLSSTKNQSLPQTAVLDIRPRMEQESQLTISPDAPDSSYLFTDFASSFTGALIVRLNSSYLLDSQYTWDEEAHSLFVDVGVEVGDLVTVIGGTR